MNNEILEKPIKEGKITNIVMDSQLLTTLMACPRKTNLTFKENLKEKRGKSNSLEMGSLAHTILEFYSKAIMQGKNRQDAIDIGFTAGKEYVTGYTPTNQYIKDEDEKGIKNTPLTAYDGMPNYVITVEQAVKTMEEYFDYYRSDMWTILGVEEVKGRIIYEDEELRILWKAKYDLIVDTNAGVMSVDRKTAKQRKDTIELNNQFIGQCTILNARNIIIDKIGWQKTLKPNEKFTRPVISYSPDIMAEWTNEIVPYYARMYAAYSEAGYFPPNYTACESKYDLCQFYTDICRMDRGMREENMKIFFDVGKVWDINNDD
jgi:hypothetical protein